MELEHDRRGATKLFMANILHKPSWVDHNNPNLDMEDYYKYEGMKSAQPQDTSQEEIIDLDEATNIASSEEELIDLHEATNITTRREFPLVPSNNTATQAFFTSRVECITTDALTNVFFTTERLIQQSVFADGYPLNCQSAS